MRRPATSQRSAPGSSRSRPAPWGARFQVALPLATAIALSVVFAVLLVRQARGPGEPPGAAPPAPSPQAEAAARIFGEPIPQGTPTERNPYQWKVPERFGGKFPRWNLKERPEGWDEKLAATLHSYFEALEIDPKRVKDPNELARIRQELRDFLATLGPEAVPTLAAILNAEGDFVNRRDLLYALGDLGPKSEAPTYVLHDFFMSRYEDPQNRSEMIHVVKAMEGLKNDSSFETLRVWIERQDNPALHSFRDKFIESLGEHPRREEAIGLFIHAMHEDTLVHARNKSAQALGKIRSPEALEDLYSAAQRERYWVVKQTILGSIGKIGSPDSVPFLQGQVLGAKESSVRMSAAAALRRIGTPYAMQVLQEAARAEPDDEVKKREEAWAGGKEP